MTDSDPSSFTRAAEFHTTRWSLVVGAQGRSVRDTVASLEALCRLYWPPLYAYVRRRGHSPHDAQDLTQEFFARLLEKNWLAAVEPEHGRMRSFLLMAMKRFLANQWDHAQAAKRGGAAGFVSLDTAEGEHLYASAAATLTDDSFYDRGWALTVLEAVLRRLRAEHEQAGRIRDYEILKPCLTAERGDIDYDHLAAKLGMEPASARSAVHRFRKSFRAIFRDEVAGTVASPDDIDGEMRALIAALGAG